MWQCQEVFYFPVTFFLSIWYTLGIDPVTGNGGALRWTMMYLKQCPYRKPISRWLCLWCSAWSSALYTIWSTHGLLQRPRTPASSPASLSAPRCSVSWLHSVIFSGLAEVPPSQDFSGKKIMTPRGGSVLSAFSAPSSSALLLPFWCCFFRHPFCIFWVPGTIPSPMPAPITAFWFSAALPLSLILSRGICSAQKVWQMMPWLVPSSALCLIFF